MIAYYSNIRSSCTCQATVCRCPTASPYDRYVTYSNTSQATPVRDVPRVVSQPRLRFYFTQPPGNRPPPDDKAGAASLFSTAAMSQKISRWRLRALAKL